ncbi:hypothetical protein K3217_02660 [bacterium BD-1]|nr:hypothetical protein [Ottowia caeni]
MRTPGKRTLLHAFALTAALSLAACGGGDDSSDPPAPPPPPPAPPPSVSLSGEVARNGTLKNVVVCLDLNSNDACDSGEPASAATDADGKYTVSYDPTAVPNAASSRLIAPVKTGDPAASTTAIDSYNPAVAATTTDYVLKRSAGSGGAINPLTTLVEAGVAAGMTEAAARANVALQLAIDPAKIDGYQDDPPWDDAQVRDNARTAAALISTMLRTGAPLEVGDHNGAVSADTLLNNLFYQDAGNFYVQTLETQAKAAGTGGATLLDTRVGKTGGVNRPIGNDPNALHRWAMLSPDGWKWCGPAEAVEITVGNPNRALVCGSRVQIGWSLGVDIAGQDMAGFVSTRSATFNVTDPAAALGSTAFPTGSEERLGSSVVLAPEVQIDNFFTRAQPASRRTLEAVIAAFPTSGAAAPAGGNTLSLAVTTSASRNLRVSFAPASPTQGVAQYYECDLNPEQTVVSNCAASTTGGYSIGIVNGERLLRFTGQPPTPAINFNVVYTQIRWEANNPDSQWVYRAHELKADFNSRLSGTDRLNAVAWNAMKAKLGL